MTNGLCAECQMDGFRYVVRTARAESDCNTTGPESREDDRAELVDALRNIGATYEQIKQLMNEGWPTR